MPYIKVSDLEIQDDNLRLLLFASPGESITMPGFGTYTIPQAATVESVTSEYISEGAYPVKKETVVLKLNSLSGQEINDLVQNMKGQSFTTHKTKIILPEGDDDPTNFNYTTYQNDAFSYYNLRNDQYESYTLANQEKILPNFCLGALWSRGEETAEQENYYTMLGSIESLRDSNMLIGETPINNFEFDDEGLEYDTSPEYEEAVDYFKNMLNNGEVSRPNYENASTHVYVDFNLLPSETGQVGNVPFFNKIRLPFAPPSDLDINLGDDPVPGTIKAFYESHMSDKLIKSFRQSNSFLRDFTVNIDGEETTAQLKVYDLLEAIEGVSYGQQLVQSDEMYLRSGVQDYATDSNSPFVFYIKKLILLGKIRTVVKNRMLGFEDLVVENLDHHHEHIGFKVIKTRLGINSPIQTFYFLNLDGLEDFIDTQIKFDTVYTYNIIAMFAVHGSTYEYRDLTTESSQYVDEDGNPIETERLLNIEFIVKPSVKVVEVPFQTYSLRIVEPPPIVPEITFYNEKDKRNKLKIRLEHQDGNIVDEYSRKPMRPFAGNETYIAKLGQYFRSDDIVITSGKTSDGIYEIYRLEEPPQSYLDFQNALIATVSSRTSFSNNSKSKNVMFADMIRHQKKYYYAFRTITHRNNPSELSEVYVVEMYEDADETFLTFDLYNFPAPKKMDIASKMRKFIQITPNIEQTLPNDVDLLSRYENAEDALDHVKLGVDGLEESIWTFKDKKKFLKLRLESKNSGRKIDLNLIFTKKIINN